MALGIRGNARLKILFIGNSFTARNNLPGLIAQLAAGRGKSIQHHLITAGGASLRTHWNAGEALRTIQHGQYDYVVLQEQSTLPIKNAKRMHENVRLFDKAIKAAGAKTGKRANRSARKGANNVWHCSLQERLGDQRRHGRKALAGEGA
jgi:hypothetical protein